MIIVSNPPAMYFSTLAWLHLLSNLLIGMGSHFWVSPQPVLPQAEQTHRSGAPTPDPLLLDSTKFITTLPVVFQMRSNKCRVKMNKHFCCCSAYPSVGTVKFRRHR